MKKLNAMIYKRHYVQVIFLQVILTATIFVLAWTLFQPHLALTSLNLGILVVFEVIFIIHVLNKTNRDLTRFFEAFQFQDGTVSLSSYAHTKTYTPLLHRLNQLLKEFQDLRKTVERDKFFYKHALNHIGIGLMVISQEGIIKFSNRAIQKMLNLPVLNDLEQLNKLTSGLKSAVLRMTPNSKDLIKVVLNNEVIQLSLRCSMFRIDTDVYRIVSFQDIKFEIEKNEAESWQKLIRILTHEIMNSVSPITLTSSGLIQMIEKEGHAGANHVTGQNVRDNIYMGLDAIRKRSKGLAAFVENYQAVFHISQPVLAPFSVDKFLSQISILMKEELDNKSVNMEISAIPASLVLYADEKQLGQVMINLIQNSLYAMENTSFKIIRICASQINSQIRISVTDNGKGIQPEMLDTVFIPFFTTREQGSGIGLSLSRQIMKSHGGGIRVKSEPGKETTFTLIFD